ncbi:MAG: hypothetical protein NTV51_01250, partial [Verrucomicrobia bacterium]|nr:hypothetical protein [Verrucomicrobiota bacterium]
AGQRPALPGKSDRIAQNPSKSNQIKVDQGSSDQTKAALNHETHERHENQRRSHIRARHRDGDSVPSVFTGKIHCLNPREADQFQPNPSKSDQIKVDQGTSGHRLPVSGARRSE